MIILPDKQTIYCDVDDTLVMWDFKEGSLLIDGVCVNPHTTHIEMLKEYKERGYNIVVWSQGGSDWAAAVVKELKLEDIVDLVITKPMVYIDDLHCTQFMGERIYKKYKELPDD